MLDPHLVEQIANDLGTSPGLVEKDWHVVRALRILASFDHAGSQPVFAGGTSLSKGWGLIKRFSEDIDFKVAMPPAASATKERNERSAYRDRVLAALSAADFELVGEVEKRNASKFFAANLAYPSTFGATLGLRPHLRIEMTFTSSALPPVARSIQSLVGLAERREPEVTSFLCVDAVETAADKLSALAWRVCTRVRGSEDDDPTIIRHLHDLAALESIVSSAESFKELVWQAVKDDANRGGGTAPLEPKDRFTFMLDKLKTDKLWIGEYEQYVRQVSFARPDEVTGFKEALAAVERLIAGVLSNR